MNICKIEGCKLECQKHPAGQYNHAKCPDHVRAGGLDAARVRRAIEVGESITRIEYSKLSRSEQRELRAKYNGLLEDTSLTPVVPEIVVHPTTPAQDEYAALKEEVKRKDEEVKSTASKLNLIPTDRVLYGYRDRSHKVGRYKLGETVELNGRKLDGTQTLQPDADGGVICNRVFHTATKADIVRQEAEAFRLLALLDCPRVPHRKTLRDSEFVDNATAGLIFDVINKLADEWNGDL